MPKDSSSELQPFVGKLQSTPYPWDLHDELAALGLAPKLLDGDCLFPGGVEVIRMAYLDPDDGWEPLGRFSGEWRGVEELCENALVQLHACLGGRAVHGDLNTYNVYIRYDLAQHAPMGRWKLKWAYLRKEFWPSAPEQQVKQLGYNIGSRINASMS